MFAARRLLFAIAQRLGTLRRIADRADKASAYLDRYYIFGNAGSRWFLALHRIHKSDSDSALHNHPWPFAAMMLAGCYYEHQPSGVYKRRPGYLRWRSRASLHRLELRDGECWSLFLGGPRRGSWGFLNSSGKIIEHALYLSYGNG